MSLPRAALLGTTLALALPASAAADSRMTLARGELTFLSEDPGVANALLVEPAAGNRIRFLDEADPAGISFPAPACSPGKVNSGGLPVEVFCDRAAVRTISINIGGAEDRVSYRLDTVPAAVEGRTGADELSTAGGADTVSGDQGNDTIDTGGGDDEARGEDGNDVLRTGDGTDRVFGGAGADTIESGAGDDSIGVADGVADSVDCGPGNDIVVADADDRLAGCERVDNRTVTPPPDPPVGDDRSKPVLQVGGSTSQRVSMRRRRVAVAATCSESALVHVAGYLQVAGINVRLRPAAGSVPVAGGGVELVVGLTGGQVRRALRDLRRGRRVQARLTLAATDPAGNTSPAQRLTIRLRG